MKKVKSPLLYTLYAVVVGMVLLYWLFPEQAVIRLVSDRFEHAFPGRRIDIQRLGPVPFFSLGLRGVHIQGPGDQRLQISKVTVSPRLTRLIRGNLSLDYRGEAYGGKFNGTVAFAEGASAKPNAATLTLSAIQLRQLIMDAIEAAPQLSGLADGELTYRATETPADAILGNLTFREVAFDVPMLSEEVATLNFSTVASEFSATHHMVNLKKVVFDGPQLGGDLKGIIHIRRPMPQSRLNLKLKVSLHPEYRDQLSQALPVLLMQSPDDPSDGQPGAYELTLFGTLEKPGASLAR